MDTEAQDLLKLILSLETDEVDFCWDLHPRVGLVLILGELLKKTPPYEFP